MSRGGRPPNSAPSLPLHSSPSAPLESLQTPDTSSLFLSSLGSHAGPRSAEFSSLEDLLNFSGISSSAPSSLESLARDLEQRQGNYEPVATGGTLQLGNTYTSTFAAAPPGPPDAKRLCTTATSLSLPLTTSNTPPSTVLVSPLPLPKTTSTFTKNSAVSPVSIPTLFPAARHSGPLTTTETKPLQLPLSTSEPNSNSVRPAPTKPGSSAGTVGVFAGSLSPTASASANSLVVPSVLGQSSTSSIKPLSSSSLALPTASLTVSSLPNTLATSTAVANTKPNPSPIGALSSSPAGSSHTPPLSSLPSHPAQRALLVQLVQAYKQCSALGDTQGQARVKAQLNLLLQAQQKMASLSNHTPVCPPQTQVSPLTPSLLINTGKGAEPVVTAPVSMATNSLLGPSRGAVPPSSSSPDLSPSTLTPIPTQSRVTAPSGSASALKAAALYNLRLRQLQLFLQSLPEDQRPHSIPELKALLQKSGGPLGNLTQTVTGTSSAAQPVPTLLCTSTPQAVPTQTVPTVGQCLPQLGLGPPATGSPILPLPVSLSTATTSFPSSTASLLSSLSRGNMPLSPTTLSRFVGGQLSSSSVSSISSLTTSQPKTTIAGATQTQPLTTPAPQSALPGSEANKSLATPTSSTSNSEPIKPGVPTPLPPGVNPETLAVLCRMPDAELQKLKLPAVLMTAIRVWRGQQSSALQRGRKQTGSQAVPIIIPPPQPATSISAPKIIATAQTTPLALSPSTIRAQPVSRPVTRHQVRAEQNKAEKDRLVALNKVLQSSEEARIAYRFNMLKDKMTNQLMTPDSHTPFKSLHDVIARLLPYHMWSEAEPPPGAIEKADAVYESVAQVLMSRSQGLMSNYQHLVYHDARRDSEAVMMVCLERLFQQSEEERREQESWQSQQAAQVAADLSLIAGPLGIGQGPLSGLDFDAEFALGDVMNSDPMLTFEPGIT